MRGARDDGGAPVRPRRTSAQAAPGMGSHPSPSAPRRRWASRGSASRSRATAPSGSSTPAATAPTRASRSPRAPPARHRSAPPRRPVPGRRSEHPRDPPTIKVDRQGNVTAAWAPLQRVGVVAQAGLHPAGGDLGLHLRTSPTRRSRSARSISRSATAGTPSSSGERSMARLPRLVEAVTRPTGSPIFGSRSFISPASGTGMCPPQAAMDAAGDVVALWQRLYDVDGGGTSRWVMPSNTKAAGGSWSARGHAERVRVRTSAARTPVPTTSR